jgi:hypothetical protein
MQLKTILRQVSGPRGKQVQGCMLGSILGLTVVSPLCGRRGMKAAFLLGCSLTWLQRAQLGFLRGTTPCHATRRKQQPCCSGLSWRPDRSPCAKSTAGKAQARRLPILSLTSPHDAVTSPSRRSTNAFPTQVATVPSPAGVRQKPDGVCRLTGGNWASESRGDCPQKG